MILRNFPSDRSETVFLSEPKLEKGMKIDIVQRETRATAISLGFPIDVNRASEDYAALALVASYFGQHRSSNSYLYGQTPRRPRLELRRLCLYRIFPARNVSIPTRSESRTQQQIFQIWIRPVEPAKRKFHASRNALRIRQTR